MNTPPSRAHALQDRLINHAATLLDVSAKLRKSPQASHISKQLIRSGTAVASNYGEARGAESKPDFVHKMRIVLKELNETSVWLQLIVKAGYSAENISTVVAENDELCRIIAASIKTAGGFAR
jgi:four helix bundle protein